jgi:hypothetical protein
LIWDQRSLMSYSEYIIAPAPAVFTIVNAPNASSMQLT